MKSLKESLFDKKGTLDRDIHKYHPQTSAELRKCIREELKLQGPCANLNCIDTSNITDMSWLFDGYEDIQNINISEWDVSEVKDMKGMFYGCNEFNCDLSRWDVSKVENMRYMFLGCKKFNCNLSRWDVSKVRYMEDMFYECKKFNSNLSGWDVKNIKYMRGMFYKCTSLRKKPDWYKL